MKNSYEAYRLLEEDADSEKSLEFSSSQPRSSRRYLKKGVVSVFITVMSVSSLVVNSFLVYYIIQLRGQLQTAGATQFAGLTFDTPIPYEWHTPYNGENQTLADELWANLQPEIDAGLVALTDEYTKDNDLLYAQRFPWQKGMGIYFLNGLHSMHCLKNVRRAFFEYRRGEAQSASFHHINHCLDTIRQDLMCFADDTPRNTGTTGPMESGVGQIRMCRSWDKLQEWAVQHTACFRYTDEDIEHNELTRYKFCPKEGMKYMPRIRQYLGLPEDWMPPPFDVKNYLNTGIDGLKGAAKFAPDNVD